jgi:hypothetical protein
VSVAITASQALNASGWQQAYIAALVETDQDKINNLITAAELAVLSRVSELIQAGAGNHRLEGTALDAALLGLYSLRVATEANNSAAPKRLSA